MSQDQTLQDQTPPRSTPGMRRTFYLTITLDDPEPDTAPITLGRLAELTAGVLGPQLGRVDVQACAEPTDLNPYQGGRYAGTSVDDSSWQALCAQVRAALNVPGLDLEAATAFLQQDLLGSWASKRRLKRFRTGSFADVPGGEVRARSRGLDTTPTLPIATADQLRLVLAGLALLQTRQNADTGTAVP